MLKACDGIEVLRAEVGYQGSGAFQFSPPLIVRPGSTVTIGAAGSVNYGNGTVKLGITGYTLTAADFGL